MAHQSSLQVFLGIIMLPLFILCICLALNSFYAKIAQWFSRVGQSTQVNVTMGEMFDQSPAAKKDGPPNPESKGKVK